MDGDEPPDASANGAAPVPDKPRLLLRTGGYTSSPHHPGILRHEPEAVDGAYQALVTDRAHRAAESDRTSGLERFLERAHRQAEHHAAQLRHWERTARRLERRLNGSRP